MNHDFHTWIEDVRSRNPIVDVIGQDASDLKPAGRNRFRCCSPLRSEKDPSFYVWTDTNERWWDFGIQIGGDVFDFIRERDKCSFIEAANKLAHRSGIAPWAPGGSDNGLSDLTKEKLLELVERRRVFDLLTQAAHYYHKSLPDFAREHLRKEYGFTDETIDEFCIGWADGLLLAEFVQERGVDLDKLKQTGLVIDTAAGPRDFFDQRIVFPYIIGGQCRYMIARRFEGKTPDFDWEKGKYKKLLTQNDDRPYVSKYIQNEWFFGEDSVRRTRSEAIITEGVTDCIAALQAGFACFSPVTTRFRQQDHERMIALTERVEKIYIVNDEEEGKADARTGIIRKPGLEGAIDTTSALFNAGRDARLLRLPREEHQEKVDLNSFLRDQGQPAFSQVKEQTPPFPIYLADNIPKDASPANLEKMLEPVLQLVASTSAITREAYIEHLCKRFGLKKRTLNKALGEHVTKLGQTKELPASVKHDTIVPPPSSDHLPEDVFDGIDPIDEPPRPESSAPRSSKRPDSNGSGRESSLIHESPDGYYFVVSGEEVMRISSFIIVPKERLITDDGEEYIVGDFVTTSGKRLENRVFPPKVWHSRRNFMDVLRSPDLTWKGGDNNVQDVLRHINTIPVPEKKGTKVAGYYEVDGAPIWITPDKCLDANGEVEPPSVRLVTNSHLLPKHTDYRISETLEAQKIATALFTNILDLNEPEVIIPLIGWFFATPLATPIQQELGHFPLLWVWGSAGTGKTTIVRDVFWRLLGVTKEQDLFSVTDTDFAKIATMSCTNGIPVIYDEYRPSDMNPRVTQNLHRFLRRAYTRDVEQRGRADMSVMTFPLCAPIGIIGEAICQDTAIQERIICVSPRKKSLNAFRSKALRALTSLELNKLSGRFTKFCLSRDVGADLNKARQHTDKILTKLGRSLPERIYDNIVVMLYGLSLFDEWAQTFGFDPLGHGRINLVDTVNATISDIIDQDDGGATNPFEIFLEEMSTYARLGIIREGHQYAVVCTKYDRDKRYIALHLESAYSAFLTERRREGREDHTNGLRALRRAVRELHDVPNSFITNPSFRCRFTLGDRHQIRTVLIDPDAIPTHMNFQTFPHFHAHEIDGDGSSSNEPN